MALLSISSNFVVPVNVGKTSSEFLNSDESKSLSFGFNQMEVRLFPVLVYSWSKACKI